MSDSSRAQLLISAETVFDEVPASPVMSILRYVTDSLSPRNDNAVSDEVRADRMRSDQILLGIGTEGSVDFEFSAGTYDALIEAALCGTWSSAGVLPGNVKNGIVNRPFLIQRGYLDVNQFFQFRGCVVEEWNMDISAHSKITGNFSFMGSRMTRSGTTVNSGTATPATSTSIMASGPLITGVTSNTDMTGAEVRSLKFQVKNNLRAHEVINSLASADYGRGPQDVTGSIEMYFKNGLSVDKFLANTSQAFSFSVGDPVDTTKGYTFTLPKIKFTEISGLEGSGVENDVIVTLGFRSFYDATAAAQIIVART